MSTILQVVPRPKLYVAPDLSRPGKFPSPIEEIRKPHSRDKAPNPTNITASFKEIVLRSPGDWRSDAVR